MEDFLAGFQHRFHELVGRCFQSAFSFFHLAFCGLRFSFFCVCVLEYAVITSLLMFWCFHVLPDLSQLSFYTFDLFTFKLWTFFSPCFKASPLDWKSVESCSFKSLNMTFNFFTIPLCSLIDQSSLLLSLGFNSVLSWHGKLSLTPLSVDGCSERLSEQPSTLRKVASFSACKISNCLDRSAVNVAFKFAIIVQFGMSLFHDAHVVMRSFPVGLTI